MLRHKSAGARSKAPATPPQSFVGARYIAPATPRALPSPPASAKAKGLGALACICLLLLASCKPKSHEADPEVRIPLEDAAYQPGALEDSAYSYDASPSLEAETSSQETTPAPQEKTPAEFYQEMLAAITANHSLKILHKDGQRIWFATRNADGKYGTLLGVYNSDPVDLSSVSLNKTYQDDDAMEIEDIEARDGIITVIMSEMRNSNGWIEGTFVWQYNCRTGAWKPLAEEVSGAKFVNGRKSVRINRTEILNPDAPTYEQQYRPRYTTIPL